jgi:hypothetical protein
MNMTLQLCLTSWKDNIFQDFECMRRKGCNVALDRTRRNGKKYSDFPDPDLGFRFGNGAGDKAAQVIVEL